MAGPGMLYISSDNPLLCTNNTCGYSIPYRTDLFVFSRKHCGSAFRMGVHRTLLWHSSAVPLTHDGGSYGFFPLFRSKSYGHISQLQSRFDLIMSFGSYFLLSAGSDRNYYIAYCSGEHHLTIQFLPPKCYLHFCNQRFLCSVECKSEGYIKYRLACSTSIVEPFKGKFGFGRASFYGRFPVFEHSKADGMKFSIAEVNVTSPERMMCGHFLLCYCCLLLFQ